MSDEPVCYCGHLADEHERTGECSIDGCSCFAFDEDPGGDIDDE